MNLPARPIIPVTLLGLAILLAVVGCSDDVSTAARSQATYVVLSIADSAGPCGDSSQPCARLSITYPQITAASNPGAVDVANREVHRMLREGAGIQDTGAVIDIIVGDFSGDYLTLLEEFPSYSLPWVFEVEIDVIANGGDVLSLEYVGFTFSGGAHPNSLVQHANIDLRQSRVLSLDDLFVEGYLPELETLTDPYFRDARGLSPDDDLSAAGLWFDDGVVRLPEGFLIDVDGLTFHYNAYEIAPYSMGPTSMRIPYEALQCILRPDGPVYRWQSFVDRVSPE